MNFLFALLDAAPSVTVSIPDSAEAVTQAAAAAGEAAKGGLFSGVGGNTLYMVAYFAVLIAIFYFFAIKPQKKKAKALQEMQEAIKVGDEVMTSSGFFGSVVSIEEDRVIVEFGASGSKSVRVPVKKSEIYSSNGQAVEK